MELVRHKVDAQVWENKIQMVVKHKMKVTVVLSSPKLYRVFPFQNYKKREQKCFNFMLKITHFKITY